MRLGIAILLLAGVWSGVCAADDDDAPNPPASRPSPISTPIPLPRARPAMPPVWAQPMTFREAAGPDFKSEDVTSAPSDCRQRLEKFAVVAAIPRLVGPGSCGGGDMIALSAVRLAGNIEIAVKPAPILRCAMAESVAIWIRDEAAPRMGTTGSALRSVETYDDFNCRGRNRIKGARMSEHGRGNAVDIRSLTLADGKVMQPSDIHVPKDLRAGLRESVCARFTTVLGPGSDGFHEEHIHLDQAERTNGFRICQWDVREPPPPKPDVPADPTAIIMAEKPLPMAFEPPVSVAPARAKRKL